jgi:hypothetical protein
MKKEILFALALIFALGLAGCATSKNTKTQKHAKCGHLEICHGDHHHHNSRHHHGGRPDCASEQNETEQTSD